jgi:tripartite-type tricarboxylate transporter receptor subunit TctC
MSKRLGQPLNVENRPGANGLLAVNELINSKPDGYTILLGTNGTFTLAPARQNKLTYDIKRDFTLIGGAVSYPHMLVVPTASPATDFASFLKIAKEKKTGLNGASVGHANDLTIAWLKEVSGISITPISYKGDAAVMTDLVSNRLDFALLAPNVATPLIEGQKIKAIALTAPGGTNALNAIKTIKDSGLPDFSNFEMDIWNCLVAPAGTPPDLVARLADALRKTQEMPEIQSKLALSGQHVQIASAEALAQRIDREIAHWQAIVKKTGLPMLDM